MPHFNDDTVSALAKLKRSLFFSFGNGANYCIK